MVWGSKTWRQMGRGKGHIKTHCRAPSGAPQVTDSAMNRDSSWQDGGLCSWRGPCQSRAGQRDKVGKVREGNATGEPLTQLAAWEKSSNLPGPYFPNRKMVQ